MKDRIPLNNGKNNKIKLDLSNIANFDELKTANNAGLLRADVFANNDGTGTTEIGTALNKANLLTDQTASKIGLDNSNPTINDALNCVAWQVGDIRTSIKNSLGSKWLQCDGSKIDQATYPALCSDLDYKSIDSTYTNSIVSDGIYGYRKIINANYYYRVGTSCHVFITATPGSNETELVFPRTSNFYIVDFAYNGTYYCFTYGWTGSYANNDTGAYYSANVFGDYTLAVQEGTDRAGYTPGNVIVNSNNEFVFSIGQYVYHGSNPASLTKSSNILNSSTSNYYSYVCYGNGYYVFSCPDATKTLFKYSTDLNSFVSVSTSSSIERIDFINGYFVTYGYHYYTTSPTISFTENTNSYTSKSSRSDCKIFSYNGKFYRFDSTAETINSKYYPEIVGLCSDTISGDVSTFKIIKIGDSYSSYQSPTIDSYYFYNSDIYFDVVSVGQEYRIRSNAGYYKPLLENNSTVQKVYYYIKAKD